MGNASPKYIGTDKKHRSMSTKIGIWAETILAVSSSQPIVKKYLEKGYTILYYTNTKLFPYCESIFDSDQVSIICFSKISSKQNIIGGRFTNRFFKIYFVSPSFSPEYPRQQTRELSRQQIKLNNAFRFFHFKNEKINEWYQKLVSVFYRLKVFKNFFDEELDFIIVFTPVYYPFHLTPILKKIILIVESWDHPVKRPFLVTPAKCLVWNKDLKAEVKTYQNISEVSFIKPIKFNYIAQRQCQSENELIEQLPEALKEDVLYVKNNKTIVYPLCMPRHRLQGNDEILFIEYLSKILNNLGYRLYIRPYPLAPVSDIDPLTQIPNCKIGYLDDNGDAMHLINEQELHHKYLLLKYAHLVINIGTTFVFDAAYAGSNILQVQVTTDRFGSMLRKVSTYGHIAHYLNSSIYTFKLLDDNEQIFTERIQSADKKHGVYLKNWLLNKV